MFDRHNWKTSLTTSIVVSSLVFSVGLFLCASAALFAQSESGVVTGQVQDPQGAPVAGAEVTATNTETGVATVVKTSDIGIFFFQPSSQPLQDRRKGSRSSGLEGALRCWLSGRPETDRSCTHANHPRQPDCGKTHSSDGRAPPRECSRGT